MIISTLIFFSSNLHTRFLNFLSKLLKLPEAIVENTTVYIPRFKLLYRISIYLMMLFLVFQLLFPFRYLFYPGELFWTEEGFRFSWRVMLMEKAGYAQFIVTDAKTGKSLYINNTDFLTRFQEKQMSFQPDFILEYAHYLHDHYQAKGMNDPKVNVQCHVALNGRLSSPYVNPDTDLAHIPESFSHKEWILPFQDKIWGL